MSEQEYRRRLQEARNRAVRLYDRLILYPGYQAESIRAGVLDVLEDAIPELENNPNQDTNGLQFIFSLIELYEGITDEL